MDDELTPEQLAAIRKGVRTAMQQGVPTSQLDSYLQQHYGLTSAQAMKPTGRDSDRAVLQGLTADHADELYGLYKKLTGGDYTTARDQVRENDAQFRGAHPWLNVLLRGIGGGGAGALASRIPVFAPVAGATMGNVGRAAGLAGAMGAIGGEGASEAHTVGGVAKDATISAVLSAAFGAAGAGVGSAIAARGLPKGSAGVVAKEAATQLPRDPVALQASLARQEALAPGSVVLADMSPEMQAMVRGVGADPKTAVVARNAAQDRLKTLVDARRAVGKNYDILKGRMEPVDPEIITAVAAAGRRGILKGAQKDIELARVHDLRSQLLAEARATRNAYTAKQKNDAADLLTGWLAKKEPAVQQLDADYAFLTERAKAAKATLTTIRDSGKHHASSRAYGVQPGSVGASVPTTLRGVPGAVLHRVGSALGPNKAARARAVGDLLLTPSQNAEGLARLTQLHDLLLNPPSSVGQAGTNAFLAGAVAPQLGASLVRP